MNRCKIFYLFIYNHEVLRLEKATYVFSHENHRGMRTDFQNVG